MYGSEREKEILKLLSQNNYTTVEYLAKKIHISPSSIRRDLKRLELKGLITRSYGGAEIKDSINKKIPFYLRSHKNSKEKTLVAQTASSLAKPGDVIFLDSSTSTYYMLEFLKNIRDITVITNSLASISVCSEYNINSFLTGGKLNPENRSCFVGMHTENMINSFHADICFFSVQSVTKEGYLYDCFENEIPVRQKMMKNSKRSAFLCDSSKINHYSAHKLCNISETDYVICDTDIEKYLQKNYTDITFLCADQKQIYSSKKGL